MVKQWVGFGARVLISLLMLVFLFTRIDINQLSYHIRNIDPVLFILAIIFFILYLCVWAFRWQLFLVDTGLDIPYLDTLRKLLIGLTASLFLPSAIGADVGRAYDMARDRVEKVKILSTVMMDRLVGLIAVIGMAIVATAIVGYQYLTIDIFIAIVGVAFMLLIGWMIFFNILFMRRFRTLFESLPIVNRFSGKIRDIYLSLYYLQQNRNLFIKSIIVSIITVALEILSAMTLSYAIGNDTNPVFFFLFLPIIWVILIIPIAIGGLGLREAVFIFFFQQVGMDAAHAVTISLLYYSFYAVTGVMTGIISILTSLYNRTKLQNQKSSSISENV